jgi:glycosyltransferase involved in cell wall biosynthesis
MYKAADAFVLPSHGEGWGRPIMEAMSMGLPVIATNWSGQTAYDAFHRLRCFVLSPHIELGVAAAPAPDFHPRMVRCG